MKGLLAASVVVASAVAGFVAGTHYYANADLPTKLELQKVSRGLASVGPTIQERCASEWGTDYRMRGYCVERQTEAKQSGNF